MNLNLDPTCKHGTHVAQTQCKYCMNDELIELRSRLQASETYAIDLMHSRDALAERLATAQKANANYLSRLQAISEYAVHSTGCMEYPLNADGSRPHCTCGLDQLRVVERQEIKS